MRMTILLALLGLVFPSLAVAQTREATVYKDPNCGCCAAYVHYLEQNGFKVTVRNTPNLTAIKRQHGVPEPLEGCHTTLVGGYVVEGHVPVTVLNKLLAEKPAIKGISLPGMPEGSPGMSGTKQEPFTIYEIGSDAQKVYAAE